MASHLPRYLVGVLATLLFCSAQPTLAQQPEPAQRIRLFGDLRLRGEWDIDRTGSEDRARPRIRFRAGVEARLTSQLVVGARMATGSNLRDPNSPHQTLGNGFKTYEFRLDRAFLRWQPPLEQPVTVYAGKFGNPLVNAAIYSELVWDADIQPEGLAVVLGPIGGFRVVGAQYLLLQRSPGKSVGLTAGQAHWSNVISGPVRGAVALGFYGFERPDAGGSALLAQENQGNALAIDAAGDTLFLSDFDIVQAFASLRYDARFPVLVSGQFIKNTSAADGFDDDGFALGVQVGKLGEVRDWRVFYQYQQLGQEAAFAPFVHDDFLNGTNFRGHVAGVTVQVWPRAVVNLWTLWSATDDPRVDTLQKRFRLDLNMSF